ncbi:rRNA 2'-O-methyltransferase fibrillarin-like [Mytilus trossulus]|uniref:rRNA 2'-O-methyltransferase fibrillarin-like n=1 Tax=Mytilus trossulus TaxID=6551 RepID=UPI003007A83E
MNCATIIVIASISVVFYLNSVTAQVNVDITGGGGGGGGGDQAPGGRGGDVNTKIVIKGVGRGGIKVNGNGVRQGGKGRLNNKGRRRGGQNIGFGGRGQVRGRGQVWGRGQIRGLGRGGGQYRGSLGHAGGFRRF